jgi:hypothetical protein
MEKNVQLVVKKECEWRRGAECLLRKETLTRRRAFLLYIWLFPFFPSRIDASSLVVQRLPCRGIARSAPFISTVHFKP